MPFHPRMKAFYGEHGYLVVEGLFDDAELAGVRQRTAEIAADPAGAPPGISVGREGDTVSDRSRPEAGNDAVRGMAFVARFDPVYRELARHPKLLALVRGLLGPRVQLFRDQMLLKPPGGQPKPLHQDQSYFRVTPIDALVTAWVALDDATLENGCMAYVPGSHRHGIFPITSDPAAPVHHVPDTGGITLPDPVLCPVPAGSVIFHHGCTLHASALNRTETWRRALILHYAEAAARSENAKLNEEISLRID